MFNFDLASHNVFTITKDFYKKTLVHRVLKNRLSYTVFIHFNTFVSLMTSHIT